MGVGTGLGVHEKYIPVLLGNYGTVVDWEFLAYGVWAIRSIPEGVYGGRTHWTAVVVAQGDIARIVLGERINTRSKVNELLQSITNHHFNSAFAVRKQKVKWYKLPNPTTGTANGYGNTPKRNGTHT